VIMEKLDECRHVIERTRWIDEQIMALRSCTERTTSVLHKTPRGTAPADTLESQLDDITSLERYFSTELIAAMKLIVEVDGWLRQLPRRHEDVMRLRYVDARTWSGVAAETHYTLDHCFKLHREAVKIFERIENGQ
jgi:hypothetical protein